MLFRSYGNYDNLMVFNHQTALKKLICSFKKLNAINFNMKTYVLTVSEFSFTLALVGNRQIKALGFITTFYADPHYHTGLKR